VPRKVSKNGLSSPSNSGESDHSDNDIPPDEGEYKSRRLHWILRTMSVVELHILDFCLGFSSGRYSYFFNVLKENIRPQDFGVQRQKERDC